MRFEDLVLTRSRVLIPVQRIVLSNSAVCKKEIFEARFEDVGSIGMEII